MHIIMTGRKKRQSPSNLTYYCNHFFSPPLFFHLLHLQYYSVNFLDEFVKFDLTDSMRNTELEMIQGMQLHKEMQARQAQQIAQYAGGIDKTLQGDQSSSAFPLRRGSLSSCSSRRGSVNDIQHGWSFDNSQLFESNVSQVESSMLSPNGNGSTKFNDFIPQLEGSTSDVGGDGDEDLFNFLFD